MHYVLRATTAFSILLAAAAPAAAQNAKRVNFAGNAAAEAMTAVKADKLEALKGVRSVIIPQFTVEFVKRSDGLSAREERRQDYVKVVYEVGGLSTNAQQALTDKLYARWVAGLQAQGITVRGPKEALATQSWAKLGQSAKPSPALIARASGANHIFNVGAAPYLLPFGSTGEVTGASAALSTADTGAAVASKVGGRALGRMGGMFGMARGLAKMGEGLGRFGDATRYVSGELAMAKETGAGVMTVRLVIGLRDTDMAMRGFGLFRTAGSYDGKPKLAILADGTEVTVTAPNSKRAAITVPQDLVFSEDVLAGRLAVSNTAGETAANVASRTVFAAAALGGGTAAINQSHEFTATPKPEDYEAAIVRNANAIEDIFLTRLRAAW
jgi:hypothetical protein